MRKKIIGIFVCILLLASIIPIGIQAHERYDPLEGGWIEERDGITILHVSGTNYEMGYQHGFLLKKEIQARYRITIRSFNSIDFTYDKFLQNWNVMKDHMPEQYMTELQGMADGSDMTLEEIAIINIVHDTINIVHCCGAIAWGTATVDGKLVHLRSADGEFLLRDLVTGQYLQEDQAVIIRNPDEGYASLYPILAGEIGCWGGINEKGIGVSETTCLPNDTTLHGIPVSFRMRMVLDSVDKGEDAIAIMNSNRTCGWNLFISDGNIPTGYVLEQSANISYVSTWNDTIESIPPFWAIPQVLRRTNCYISPICAALEREYYDPSGISGFIRYLLGLDVRFVIWTHYRVLSEGLEESWGHLDVNETMKILSDMYLCKTDPIFTLFQRLFSIYTPYHQWVACPETGEMAVTFASAHRISSANPVHHYNLFKLLESEPP